MPEGGAGPAHLVSVVIPVRDYRRYLGECLASVAGQSLAPTEVIVVDDHSEDGSFELAREWSPLVRAVRSEGSGASAARNTGVRMATGDLVAFCDADDRWDPRALELLVGALDRRAEAGLASGRVREFVSPELDEADRRRLAPRPDDTEGVLISALVARRAVFDRVGYFDESIRWGQVIDWLVRCRDAGVVFAPVDAVVAERRLHPGQLVKSHADYVAIVRDSLARRRK